MAKVNKLEHALRIEAVRQLILSGAEATYIVQTVAGDYSISERQGWNYIRDARAVILSATTPSREYLLSEHIAVRRDIRMRAQKAGDLRAELAAAQDEAKLFGLYPTEAPGVAVTVNNQTAIIGVKVIDYRDGLAALAPGSIQDSDGPGVGEAAFYGPAVGQDGARRDDGAERAAPAWASSVDRADV
jgi:hypothetical protein